MRQLAIGLSISKFKVAGDGNGGEPEPPAGFAYVISVSGAYAVSPSGGAYVLARIDNG